MHFVLICVLTTPFLISPNIAKQAAEYMDAMAGVNHYSGVVLIAKNNMRQLSCTSATFSSVKNTGPLSI
jgi:hypothetical protein